MALKVKHNRANHTHENEQFRRVASSLLQPICWNVECLPHLSFIQGFNENLSTFGSQFNKDCGNLN